ncbi:2-oxoacid:acceptor oxidoreductase family protein, partial [Campylobacter jejuni]|uniref:2-oxoacid:acceptor oxidoreductase family protein n=1 Tax=Campylobacter jejuni TaxID=197 RepID=UPI00131A3ACE
NAKNTDFCAQSYCAYDYTKTGDYARRHLRFSEKTIRSTYLVSTPHFIACSVAEYLEICDVLAGIRKGGAFLLNRSWNAGETIR